MEIAGLPKIPVAMNVTLDKRKSKLANVKGSTGLLDISSFPELTRNVSETQLLALKTAGLFLNYFDILYILLDEYNFYNKYFLGTKALSNMSEQFSKLNKLSQSFSTKKPIDLAKSIGNRKTEGTSKPIFIVGNRDISGNLKEKSNSSSSSSSDENIEMTPIHVKKPANFSHDKHLMEAYTPVIGIIMGVKNTTVVDGDVCETGMNKGLSTMRHNTNSESKPDIAIDALHLIPQSGSGTTSLSASPQKTTATTPEITVYDVGGSIDEERERMIPPSTLSLSKNISHSTGDMENKTLSGVKSATLQTDNRLDEKKRSASEQDLILNITSSQSESALKSIRENIANVTSPVASTAKDILLPFSKFAKGVQTLGANLDPRKLKTSHVIRNLSEHQMEERQKLQERWASCQSRLIAL